MQLHLVTFLLSINSSTSAGKVAFVIVDGFTTSDSLYGNVKEARDCLNAKYAPTTAHAWVKLEREFVTSKLRNDAGNHDTWITNLESLQTEMNKVKYLTGAMFSLLYYSCELRSQDRSHPLCLDKRVRRI